MREKETRLVYRIEPCLTSEKLVTYFVTAEGAVREVRQTDMHFV